MPSGIHRSAASQRSHGIRRVFAETRDPLAAPAAASDAIADLAQSLSHVAQITKLLGGLGARVLGRHAEQNEILDARFEMETDLLVDVGLYVVAPEADVSTPTRCLSGNNIGEF